MADNSKQKKDKRPIVCGTDFSATAVEAVDLAAAMAKRLGTKLVLVHVDEFHGLAAVDPTLFEAALTQKRGELVGSHGRSGLAKTFLGSVAQGVMTRSRRPVFVARVRE